MIGGDAQLGYFGALAPEGLISYSELSNQTGYSRGNLVNQNEPWLKFVFEGKILFIPKKHIRDYCQWNLLNSLGLVYGRELNVGVNTYLVRLIRGADKDPGSLPGGEWDKVLYSVSNRKPLGFSYENFTDAELGVDSQTNRGTVCMETSSSNSSNNISRGNGSSGIMNFINTTPKNYNGVYAAYRPCLELIS